MLSGVSIICFAASYAVTLALEITRPLFRSGIRGAVMIGFAGAGLFAHTVFLAYRAVESAGSPLAGKQDWYLVAAWVLVVTYLYLTYYHPKTAFGVFLLPLVLGLIGVAALVPDAQPFARPSASRLWGAIHGTSILLGTVSVLVAFAAGLMYLGQAYRLKHKLPPQPGLRLPSLEWLQRTNSRAILIALVMLGLGILAGGILNRINYDRHLTRLPWSDPFVLSTLVMFAWLLLSAGIGLFYKPARQGRKVAYLTLVSFVFLVIALGIGFSVVTQHREPGDDQGTGGQEQGVSSPSKNGESRDGWLGSSAASTQESRPVGSLRSTTATGGSVFQRVSSPLKKGCATASPEAVRRETPENTACEQTVADGEACCRLVQRVVRGLPCHPCAPWADLVLRLVLRPNVRRLGPAGLVVAGSPVGCGRETTWGLSQLLPGEHGAVPLRNAEVGLRPLSLSGGPA